MTLIQDIPKSVQQKTCYHCGADCRNQAVFSGDLPFCCTGCQSVYEILNGCSLEEYYALEKHPGIRPSEADHRFDYLQLPEERSPLIAFENDSICKVRVFIPEIHCSSCIYLLEQLHRLDPVVVSSRVSFKRRELSLTIDKNIAGEEDGLLRAFRLIARLGYTTLPVDSKSEGHLRDSRSLLVKIGITGFCFGNIMLLSIPEYIAGQSTIEPQFKQLFNLLIILLILPAIWFGAKDYAAAAWKNLKHRYLSVDVPIVIGIAALFVRSLYEIFQQGEPGYFDSLAGFLFFLLIGKWFQSRTYEHLSFDKDFKSFLPLAVLGQVDGEFRPVRVKDLKRGDIIQLRNSEVLPVNAQLLEASAEFDYSFVTGESAPVFRNKKEILFAGGRLNSASARCMVSESVSEGYLQELWREQDSKAGESRLIHLVDRISRYFTGTIIAIALAGLAYWGLTSEWHTALEIFTAILIVACPCALALAAPFTYGNAARLLSRVDAYLKHSSVVERLGSITRIVFDKTGTLTRKHHTGINYVPAVDGSAGLTAVQRRDIARISACSMHPLSKSLAQYLQDGESGLPADPIVDYREKTGYGIRASIGDNQYLIGSLEWLRHNRISPPAPVRQDGGRTRVYAAVNGHPAGYFEFSNTYRDGVLEKVSDLAGHYDVSIISGDGSFEAGYLRETLGAQVPVAFEQTPEDKRSYIEGLRADGGTVMMLGDGINDSRALKASDVGVAVTEDTGSFTPNSDVILHADSLVHLPRILQYGKDAQHILYFCLAVSLLYNLVGLSFAFTGLLTPFVAAVLMPVSSITIVIIATGLTALYARKRNIAS